MIKLIFNQMNSGYTCKRFCIYSVASLRMFDFLVSMSIPQILLSIKLKSFYCFMVFIYFEIEVHSNNASCYYSILKIQFRYMQLQSSIVKIPILIFTKSKINKQGNLGLFDDIGIFCFFVVVGNSTKTQSHTNGFGIIINVIIYANVRKSFSISVDLFRLNFKSELLFCFQQFSLVPSNSKWLDIVHWLIKSNFPNLRPFPRAIFGEMH